MESASMNDSITGDFDPARHRMTAQRYFDDFRIGERFVLPSRTMTYALF